MQTHTNTAFGSPIKRKKYILLFITGGGGGQGGLTNVKLFFRRRFKEQDLGALMLSKVSD